MVAATAALIYDIADNYSTKLLQQQIDKTSSALDTVLAASLRVTWGPVTCQGVI